MRITGTFVIPAAVKKKIGIGYNSIVRLAQEPEKIQEVLEKTKSRKRRAVMSRLLQVEKEKGMELIHQRIYEALRKLGLEPLDSTGQPFDPHVHHAVEMVETGGAPDHTILDEYQRGYNFKGRLLRPAMVKVAVAPAAK